MEGRSETTGLGSAGEHVGPGDNVDTRQQESLRAPGYRKRPSVDLEVGPLHKVNFEGVQEMAGRGGGSGGGDTVGVGPPSSPGSLVPDQGVVQGFGLPFSAVHLGYPQEDNGGEGGVVQPHTALGTNIPIYVKPFAVDDLLPTEDKIEWAVTRLRNHCSVGPSGMRSEHLKR